jgi:uroporphyrinogen decarboxylase
MRSCATFLSPDMFEEFVWPAFKGMVERYHEAGIMVVLHADADWTPMLEYFTQLPKGSLHMELDGMTNIETAYEILGGHQTIRGDVPATMLAYGTPDEVSEYCEKLITMGMKGGFVLGSGCEVPLNAKPECVKAMIDSVR